MNGGFSGFSTLENYMVILNRYVGLFLAAGLVAWSVTARSQVDTGNQINACVKGNGEAAACSVANLMPTLRNGGDMVASQRTFSDPDDNVLFLDVRRHL
jgi:hypothetical protein